MKKSYLNAVYAIIYIIGIVAIMSSKIIQGNSVVTEILILALLVLSVATMGYLFVGNPVLIYLDGKKKEAIKYFFETITSFGIMTIILLLLHIILK